LYSWRIIESWKLVQHEELLWQVRRGGEPGEPAGDGVDVARLDATNLLQRLLPGFQMPLRVQRQSDVRQPKQVGVTASLGQEVGAARLQVEHHIHPRRGGLFNPRPQRLHSRLRRVVPVRAGF